MCGFFSVLGKQYHQDFPEALNTIQSRGPDARGIHQDGDLLFGHQRLSIIDIEHAKQPMLSPDGRYCLIYNGEIYNFRLLKKELINNGVNFSYDSDTEVLLYSLIYWGIEKSLAKLDGMFGFVLWDKHEKKLYGARDCMGIKPFFYSTYQGFHCSSTLAPFFKLKNFPKKLNYTAVQDFLSRQYISHPHSMLKHVKQLPPAHYCIYDIDAKNFDLKQYWSMPKIKKQPTPNAILVKQLDQTILDSVGRQKISDVPLGAFLSGGIDSSLMVHYLSQVNSKPIDTFTVKFHNKKYDESIYAKMVADKYGTTNHIFENKDFSFELVKQAIQKLDQPLADPAYLPTLALSELTKKHITVAISGDGGDELFCGYPRYFRTIKDYPPSLLKKLLTRLKNKNILPSKLLKFSLYGIEALEYKKLELGPWNLSRKAMGKYINPEIYSQFETQNILTNWHGINNLFEQPYETDALMRADLWTYLSDNCLVKTDRASMAHSLEVRVPLLGKPVVDLILPEPASSHTHLGNKSLLKQLAEKHLPRESWDRPKHGFSVPLKDYFLNQWHDDCLGYLRQTNQLAPWLNQNNLLNLWDKVLTGRGSARLAYSFLVLLIWLESHPVDLI